MIYFCLIWRATFPKVVSLLAVSEKSLLPPGRWLTCFLKHSRWWIWELLSKFPLAAPAVCPRSLSHLVTVYDEVSIVQGDGGWLWHTHGSRRIFTLSLTAPPLQVEVRALAQRPDELFCTQTVSLLALRSRVLAVIHWG